MLCVCVPLAALAASERFDVDLRTDTHIEQKDWNNMRSQFEELFQGSPKLHEIWKKFKKLHPGIKGQPDYTLKIVPPPHEFDKKAVVRPDDSIHYYLIIINPDQRNRHNKHFPMFPRRK
jgi:hypothetical protein